MSTSAFSSSDTAALERQIDVDEEATGTLDQIWNDKHRKVCSGWIKQNGYKRVCLQFPDAYLTHSVAISDDLIALNASNDVKVFILADTSYGSCCVDEIAAAHVQADSLIHFGNACRSKVTRLPVLYMFPHFEFDELLFLKAIETLKEVCHDKSLSVYLDIGYHQLLEDGEDDEHCLSMRLKMSLCAKSCTIETYPAEDSLKTAQDNRIDDAICLFIGSDNSRFLNLSITTKCAMWYIYDPTKNTLNEKNPLTANYMRRRYYYIEKCKDAQTLGLIVATLTADGYLNVVARLQEMAKSRGIKTQIISVGRINPAKLANFLEIDCFVLIGCPFNNVYNSKDFYKPIVSVFEAEMALNPAWHLKYPEVYVTDFKQLLPDGRNFLAYDASNVQSGDFSLLSGRIRSYGEAAEYNVELANVATSLSEQQRALQTPGKLEVMTTNTGLTFEDRTWKGLDPALGLTDPAKVQKGLSGIPIKYSHD